MYAKPKWLLVLSGAGLVFAICLPLLWPFTTWPKKILDCVAIILLLTVRLRSRIMACEGDTPALRRRYLQEFVPPMVGYVLAIFASVWLLKRVDEPSLRAMIALLPVPAIALAMRAIVRRIRDTDELQRRIELEAVSIATALVSLLYLAAGFLQQAKVIDVPAGDAMIWVFPLVCLTYGLAKVAVLRHYR